MLLVPVEALVDDCVGRARIDNFYNYRGHALLGVSVKPREPKDLETVDLVVLTDYPSSGLWVGDVEVLDSDTVYEDAVSASGDGGSRGEVGNPYGLLVP